MFNNEYKTYKLLSDPSYIHDYKKSYETFMKSIEKKIIKNVITYESNCKYKKCKNKYGNRKQ